MNRAILEHMKTIKITLGLGGIKLMRDMKEYQMMADHCQSARIRSYFEGLRELGNVFIVPAENIVDLLESGDLLKRHPQDLKDLLRMRHDFHLISSRVTLLEIASDSS
eukprot:TRINITY_DN11572_c0_g2_i1.p2 TRINITY_DN11572_c0_g2~~TRINITY_DN11572_c0_g2_i1.p2  ORF type:complete len:108 (-),score=34.19 TRINITY_DN11572_c0_g2_i1:23-346(-)